MDVSAISEDAVRRGAAVYSRPVLAIYDLFVLRFTNTFVWKCPSSHILEFYDHNVSDKHLDVGVGTGYFLDRCRFPSTTPQIALMDLNENSLQKNGEAVAALSSQDLSAKCARTNRSRRLGIRVGWFELSPALSSRKYGFKAGGLRESQASAARGRRYFWDNDPRCWCATQLAW